MFGVYPVPEPDTEEKDAAPEEGVLVRSRDPHDWRVEQYERLGFSCMEALELALATDAQGFPLYWGDVQVLLERTGSHDVTWRLLR